MNDLNKAGNRRYIRFRPDEIEVALIRFGEADPDEFLFRADAAGLVLEEAYGGCGLVTLSHCDATEPIEGTRCLVKVGKMGPMRAEVRWVKRLDEHVARVGIEYIEND